MTPGSTEPLAFICTDTLAVLSCCHYSATYIHSFLACVLTVADNPLGRVGSCIRPDMVWSLARVFCESWISDITVASFSGHGVHVDVLESMFSS